MRLIKLKQSGHKYVNRWLRLLARMGNSLTGASTALTILDEVCDDKKFLESLVSHSSLLLSPKCQAAL